MPEDPLAELTEAAAAYHAAVKRHRAAVRAALKATEKRAAAAAEVERLREPMQAAGVRAVAAGQRPKVVVALTGYTPERVRQLLRAAGVVTPDRATDG